MASNEEVTIRYWVDDKQKRVVMAEAGGDFVDILFSFLTLPLGIIIRLEFEGKFRQNQPHQPVDIGCIKNLYKSVKDLKSDVFWNDICQKMLLFPRNPLEASCQRLKLKVDDTPPTKYFMCHSCSRGSDLLLSTFEGAMCDCGESMKNVELLVESKEESGGDKGVFVERDAMFLIYDDLTVLRSSPSNSVSPPLQFGHKDFSRMTEVSVNVGLDKMPGHFPYSNTLIMIFSILKQALTSKYPLSDAFLPDRESKLSYSFSPDNGPSHSEGSVEIKVMVNKSKNEIQFIEADEDFVDYLVSFLTTPLGSILNLMNGKLSLGSIDKLYKSVKNIDPSWFIGSSNKSLLNPRVAPQFGCKSNPLNSLQEEDTPKYWYGTVVTKDNKECKMISKREDKVQGPTEMKLFDPRCSVGARESGVGFMKRPCLFVVTDDLKVIPMATNSSIEYLQELKNVRPSDLEEHFVEIRKSHEALNLLRASLTSDKAVFTKSLSYLLNKWRCQRCIPFCGALLRRKEMRDKKKKEKEGKKVREVRSNRMEKKEKEKKKVKKQRNKKKMEKKGDENKQMLTTTPEEAKEEIKV
ncbi:hypothetical protein CR513_15445, partial [Mucuna pruriens]